MTTNKELWEKGDVAKEMGRVTRPSGRIIMGNWIPRDPTFVAQLLEVSAKYSPPPPEGFVSPMTWGIEGRVLDRFGAAGVPRDRISFARETFTLNTLGSPAELVHTFRNYYGPTIVTFEAAEKTGRGDQMQRELETLVASRNRSASADAIPIPATFMRVSVAL